MFRDKVAGADFFNVTQRVGKNGIWHDLLLVQTLLEYEFTQTTLRDKNPVKGQISVTGKPAADTPLLIAAFQKHVMKRPKPEGYINRAAGNDRHKMQCTIVVLNFACAFALNQNSPGTNLADYITDKQPRLKHLLQAELELPEDAPVQMHQRTDIVGTVSGISVNKNGTNYTNSLNE